MDAIGTAEVEDSGVCSFPDSGFLHRSSMTVLTVLLFMRNNSAIFRALMPSLCFSNTAASRFSFSCTERAGGYLGVVHFRDSRFCTGWLQVVLGVGILAESAVFPRRLQVVLGSVARDAVISLIQGFYSTASGCPRAPPKVSCRFAVILGTSSGFSGFPIFRNLKDGPRGSHFPFLPQGHFRKRKDGPRATDGFAQGHFRHSPRQTSGVSKREFVFWLPLRTDLGGHILGIPHFEPPPDGPRGGAKCRHSISHRLQTDLGSH